jgi:hypothetical protein
MTTQPDASERADSLRTRYRCLSMYGVTTDIEAADWLHVHSELDRLGYTLTADETDWQPKENIDVSK